MRFVCILVMEKFVHVNFNNRNCVKTNENIGDMWFYVNFVTIQGWLVTGKSLSFLNWW